MSTSINPPNGIQPEVIRSLAASTGPHPVPGADVAQAASLARWFAVYTCANHEKSVADQFAGRGVEHFLPQYESVRRWKDRKMRLQLPLFPGYVFVHMAAQERSEEHTSELQSRFDLVCRLLLEKKKKKLKNNIDHSKVLYILY